MEMASGDVVGMVEQAGFGNIAFDSSGKTLAPLRTDHVAQTSGAVGPVLLDLLVADVDI